MADVRAVAESDARTEDPVKNNHGLDLVSMGHMKLNKHAAERGHRLKKTQNNKC